MDAQRGGDDGDTGHTVGGRGHLGLRVEVADGVAQLVLDRPEKHNAVGLAMWRALPGVLAGLDADPDVRAIVVRGSGSHFCAGADIGDLLAGSDPQDPMADLRAANLGTHAAFAAVRKPTVALVRGHCIGGGLEIAAACDLRYADTTATFGVTPARLGVVYAPSSVARLVDLVGPGAASRLLFGAGLIDAPEAHRIRLVDVLTDPDELDDTVASFVAGLAGRSQLTIASAKESIRALTRAEVGGDGEDAEALAARRYVETIASGELAEGVAAFTQRRTPRFPWRW
ncbi:enoyl-CoA hydratase/isomerase family protein [Agilicoccus flavus]|uniref:enoyl-CoA hydratase/isomerase family protein n=1 Tax=Agilicoccus flavus TaxID=2775968 RepID=UPI001CF67497|nr:enoyl-CoA hydratase-related protein [Agilicoccus flavus]